MESVEKKDSLTAPSEFATTASTDAANAPTTFPVEAPPLEEEEVIIEQDPGFVSEDDEDRSVPTEDKKQDQDNAEPYQQQPRALASQDGTQKEAAAAAATHGRGGILGQSGRGGFGRGGGGHDGRLGEPRRGSFRGRRGVRRNTVTLGRIPLAGAPEIGNRFQHGYNLRSSGAAGTARSPTQP
ncbi:100K [unidentified adenovirus]|nr:100K [unidentified adenovirus]